MHPYATDLPERRRVPIVIMALSVAAAWILGFLLAHLDISVPWWLDTPSVVAFYGLFFSVFDRWLWRHPVVRRMKLSVVPDLNGRWHGEIRSSFEEHAIPHDIDVMITQSWTRMAVSGSTSQSTSKSVSASLTADAGGDSILSYEYQNEPRVDAIPTMHAHRGMCRLSFESGRLTGDYYSGRDRQETGSMELDCDVESSATEQ